MGSMKKLSILFMALACMAVLPVFPSRNRAMAAQDTAFAAIADLRAGSGGYVSGNTVTTAGFYSAGDGGGATYTIGTKAAKEPFIIPMAGGLTAELVVEDEMSVLQFGAVNDGKTDSQPALQAALDSGAAVLTFPQDGKLMLEKNLAARTSKRLEGNGCTLLTGSGWKGQAANFVQISGVSGFEWDSLNVEGKAPLSRYISIEGKSSGVVIKGSSIDARASWLFYLHGTGGDIAVRDNDIHFQAADTTADGRVFYQDLPASPAVDISGNTVSVDNTGTGKASSLFYGKINAANNAIAVNGTITHIFVKSANADNNEVAVKGNLTEFTRECMRVGDNTVNVTGAVSTVFRYHNIKLADTIILSGNRVTFGTASGSQSFALMATDITLNGNRIELYDNIISIPSKSGKIKDYIYNVNTLDAGNPVRTYKGYYEAVDTGKLENTVYINAGNVFSGSMVNTYLRGGAEVISHNAGPDPDETEPADGVDVSSMGNIIYISPDNVFSGSLTGTYLEGGVSVIE
jgi:hypothetical protein